jgi:hypothetical protein
LQKQKQNRINLPISSTRSLEVANTELETTTIFSFRKAAKAIKSDIKPILRREKQQIEKGENTPYKNRYIIYIKRENNHT